MKLAIVGATGLVGSVMLKVLEERNFSDIEIIPVASSKSVGKTVFVFGKELKIKSIEEALLSKPEIAIFSAGAAISLEYAPKFANNGTFVIDNSSAWRMNNDVPLVVPEINSLELNENTRIIANPNCSTLQMVMVLAPLHKIYKIKRLVISTYQSVTGTGVKAVKQLENEIKGIKTEMAYPYQIHKNLFPHGGNFLDDGYTSEEKKLVDETRKILSDSSIMVTSTVVRVPVTGGHSMAVNIEFQKDYNIEDIYELLNKTQGVVVYDDIKNNIYPMPIISEGKDEVFVGRIRRDYSNKNSLNLWVVADNLRKGAATNAVQIASYLIENKLVK
jgi:aspartate-semialdehyde dehydrogenase